VLSLTFSEPGWNYLRRVRIDYTTGGQEGWQYQNLNQTMINYLAQQETEGVLRLPLMASQDSIAALQEAKPPLPLSGIGLGLGLMVEAIVSRD
jgi:hypothetical protein